MVQPHHRSNNPGSAAAGPPDQSASRNAPPTTATLGELRAGGHVYRSVKDEIRRNLLAMMRAGQDPFPGIVGFGHRGQGHRTQPKSACSRPWP